MSADALSLEVEIAAPPAVVFDFFTDPAKLVLWMGDRAEVAPRPGSRFALDVGDTCVRGAVEAIDRPRRLILSWGYAGSADLPPGASTVEVVFEPIPLGTRVRLHHRDLPAARRSEHGVGWRHYLPRLVAVAIGQAVEPDPGMPSA
jgi:uncharacterized protein YndB with AHSA1/START domain